MRALGGFGPRMAHARPPEIVRAVLGALLGLTVAELLLPLSAWLDLPALALVAPFGASTVLVFAAPASPLAQPWPVVIGNLVSALAAILVVTLLPSGPWAAPVAVALAIGLMMALRALHPPGGAMALLAVLTTPAPSGPFLPTVLAGSLVLVLAGHLWGRLIRRPYPHRMDPATPPPMGLAPGALIGILEAQEQTANLGASDLAELIAAAEEAAGIQQAGPLTCADAMVPVATTLAPADSAEAMARAFADSGLSALPVMEAGRFLGVVGQIDLIRAMAQPGHPPAAAALMHAPEVQPAPETPLASLIAPMIHRGAMALPVLNEGRLVGLVTRRALLSVLLRDKGRRVSAPPAAPSP